MAERPEGWRNERSKEPPVRVLLVDDDESDSLLTRELFAEMRGLRCTLHWVADYAEALRDMKSGAHDVYLLDYRIGARTGLELLGEAKAENFRGAAILLAGEEEHEIDVEAMQAGAADYLDKGRLHTQLLERSIRYALHHKQHEDALEERIAERSAELAQATAALRLADKRKDEFLAILAHELRNPLTAIRNAVHLLRRSANKDELALSATGVLERQLGQMVRLVEDLFDVSRISRGAVELRRERIELAPVVEHALEAARTLAGNMGHELAVSLPPERLYVHADPVRLAQVVSNLLGNACKFTARGGRISISVEREGGRALIRVKDSGAGLAPGQIARIFEMFVQGDASLERSTGGLGIGLTLVKELVEMHEGTIEARSAGAGRGSEFLVRLPLLAGVAQPASQPAPSAPAAVTARRILIVDDNRDAATSLAMLLGLVGHETHVAHDGIEAVTAASRLRPDVVLLDIGLPGMNGYDAARSIRGEAWGEPMLLLALTGWNKEDVGPKSRDAGFDGYLVKPVDLDALMRLLAGSPAVRAHGAG